MAALKVVLSRVDLGPAWTSRPRTPSLFDAEDNAAAERCLDRVGAKLRQTAEVWSEQFGQGDARTILASVVFVDDRSVAEADLAAHQHDKAVPCLRQLLQVQLARSQSESATSDVQGSRLSLPDVGAPAVAAFRFKVITSSSGQDLPTFADVVLAVKGRAEIQATFQDVGQPVAEALEVQVMSAMIRRAE